MRNGILGSLLVLLAGARAGLAQGYPPYPGAGAAFPGARPAGGAWQTNFQGPTGTPMPRGSMSWPTLQPFVAPPAPAPTPAPAPPPPPASFPAPLPPGPRPAAPPADAPTPSVSAPVEDSPHEPMLSPLADGHDKEPALEELPPVAPKAGSPLFCGEELVPAKVLSHECNPPHCGPRGYRVYGTAEALSWWIRERSAPPLLTTGPAGAPGTTSILNDLSFDNQQRMGVRATVGTWLTPMQTVGLEATGLWLGSRNPQFQTNAPVLARPFQDAVSGAQSVVVLSAPGTQTGSATISALSRLWGGESNVRIQLARGCLYHLDLLTGFRYLEMDDALDIGTTTTFAPGVVGLGGSTVASSDRFGARNQFYGGQLGLEGEVHYGRFFVDLWTKIALGAVREVVQINGTTLLTGGVGVGTTALPGGLLALPTNTGRFAQEQFAVLPEVGFNCGVKLTPHLRATLGYTLVYLSNVVRSGDQIDRTINTTQRAGLLGAPGTLVGPPRPQFGFNTTDFWAQGFNAGLEFRY